MAKKRAAVNTSNGRNSISISYATIGAIGGILLIIGSLYGVATKIATKADIDSIKSSIAPTLTDHETRLRSVELQIASYFGASRTATPTPRPSSDAAESVRRFGMVLAQYIPDAHPPPQQQSLAQVPARRVVVPLEMISSYQLQPTRGGSYALLGADGRYYALDDVLAILINLHIQERKLK